MTREEVMLEFSRQGVDSRTAEKFLNWLRRNPEVWRAFQIKALQAIKRGFKRFGSKAIFEAARFDAQIQRRETFKVNNNYSAYCARLFELKYPQHKNFFEKRETRGLRATQPEAQRARTVKQLNWS